VSKEGSIEKKKKQRKKGGKDQGGGTKGRRSGDDVFHALKLGGGDLSTQGTPQKPTADHGVKLGGRRGRGLAMKYGPALEGARRRPGSLKHPKKIKRDK